jgi:hypothetical protein
VDVIQLDQRRPEQWIAGKRSLVQPLGRLVYYSSFQLCLSCNYRTPQ